VHDQQQLQLLDTAVQAVSAQAISDCSSANSSSRWKFIAQMKAAAITAAKGQQAGSMRAVADINRREQGEQHQ